MSDIADDTPRAGADSFVCPHCHVHAAQKWTPFNQPPRGAWTPPAGHWQSSSIWYGYCLRCNGYTLWLNDNLLYPNRLPVPDPNEVMPDNELKDRIKARVDQEIARMNKGKAT